MALPTLLQQQNIGNEKEVMSILREQRDVMKKLSDSILSNQRQTNSLRTDVGDIKRELILGMQEFSSLKKYFENTKSSNVNPAVKVKEREGSNFFVSAINKLLGKKDEKKEYSEFQQKMLQETNTLKSYILDNNKNISFIKKSFEDNVKAKDRKLLAQEIADAMDGSGKSSGFLGIITALGIGLAALGTAVISGLAGTIKDAFTKLGEMMMTNKLISAAKPGAAAAAGAGAGAAATVPWWKRLSTFAKGAVGATAALAPSELGNPEEQFRQEMQEKYAADPSQLEKDLERESLLAQFRASPYSDELKTLVMNDPDADTEVKKSVEGYRKILEQNNQTDKLKELDEIGEKTINSFLEKIGMANENLKQQNTNTNEQIKSGEETTDLYAIMRDKLKEVTSMFDPKDLSKDMANFLDRLGEIDLGSGKKLNLLPELGTSTAKILNDLENDIKSLTEQGSAAAINMNTVNNTSMAGGTSMVLPDASATDTDSTINDYKRRKPIQ